MSVLYVASDQQGDGKTAFCVTFAQKLSKMGKKPIVMKPITEPSDDGEPDPDVVLYEKLLGQQKSSLTATHSVSGLDKGRIAEIKSAVESASSGHDVVIIEGVSGLSLQDQFDLAESLDAKAVVITKYRRDIKASDLKSWKDTFGNRIIGFIVNGLTRYLGTESQAKLLPAMQGEGLVNLGVIPESRRLLTSSVGQIADHLNGKFLIDNGYTDRLVQHYMAWGFSLDPGELTFSLREEKAVVIRGDRPDIQMSALATPTACLICTQGIEPIEYVRYEAAEEEVAVMIVQDDTLTTMTALNGLMDKAKFDHPEKVQMFGELLDEHLDYATLFAGLSIEQ